MRCGVVAVAIMATGWLLGVEVTYPPASTQIAPAVFLCCSSLALELVVAVGVGVLLKMNSMLKMAIVALAALLASGFRPVSRNMVALPARISGLNVRTMSSPLLMTTDGAAALPVPAAPEPAKSEKLSPKTIKKLLPLGLMFFCILFNYTILRDTKDVLVVTAPNSGAEIIPFLKTYVNLPAAILFTMFYSRLCNRVPQDKVFYTVLTPFLAFFGAFATLIYPNRAFLHPNAAADVLARVLPSFFLPLVAIFRNWTYALFYVAAELWGSVVVSVLFWGFANEVTTVQEAKKYYPLFGLMANVALIFSGQYVKLVSLIRAGLAKNVDAWGHSLKLLMGAVVGGGALIMGLYNYMQREVLTDPECVNPNKEAKRKKQKTSMSLGESASFLAKSKYIRDLATLVIGYGMSINIVEVTWKSKLKAAFPDPNSYSAFMGNFSSATGVVTVSHPSLAPFPNT